jgi:hypothetical protein
MSVTRRLGGEAGPCSGDGTIEGALRGTYIRYIYPALLRVDDSVPLFCVTNTAVILSVVVIVCSSMAQLKFVQLLAILSVVRDVTNAYQSNRLHIRQDSGDQPGVVVPGASSYNGLNLVPQMGWNNWNAFHCNVNEELLLTTARDLVSFLLCFSWTSVCSHTRGAVR